MAILLHFLAMLFAFHLFSFVSVHASLFAFNDCIQKLSMMGHDMTKEEYAQLLTNLSHGQIEPYFHKLPLPLISIFSFHACHNGRPCLRNSKATISTVTTEDSTLACTTIEFQLRALDMISDPQCSDKNDTSCAQPRTIIRMS